jgi:hypothetical protein
MASHALAPSLQIGLHSPARLRLALATFVVAVLGVAGFAMALALPTAPPSPPASFQGDITAR